MIGVIFAMIMAGPWIESTDFPQAAQETAYGATLRLTIVNAQGTDSGTAVRIGKTQKIGRVFYLTAAHVVGNSKTADLEWFDPKTKVGVKIPDAEVKWTWPEKDLALLVANEITAGPSVRVCPKDKVPTAAEFAVITVGLDSEKSPMPEIWLDQAKSVKKLKRPDGTYCWCWPVGRASKTGRSGGPLINKEGYLIGICSGNNNGDGYYVSIQEIHKCLESISGQALYEKPAP